MEVVPSFILTRINSPGFSDSRGNLFRTRPVYFSREVVVLVGFAKEAGISAVVKRSEKNKTRKKPATAATVRIRFTVFMRCSVNKRMPEILRESLTKFDHKYGRPFYLGGRPTSS